MGKNYSRDGNAPESRERRTTIKKIAVGVGALAGISSLPEQWTRPVVEGIVLPAHAQTSANLLICRELFLSLLSGTQSSGTVAVRVQGCITPPTGGVAILLAVQGSQAAAGTASREPEGLLERALGAVGDLLVKEAVAADCPEIGGKAVTDAQGHFSADFEIPCGPGIQSVYAYAALTADRKNGGYGSGVVSVPGETTSTTKPVEPPKPPISPCSVGIDNRLPEDITLMSNGTEYTVAARGTLFVDLTVYEEPFSLTFRASTNTNKVLARSGTNAISKPFTDEVTVDDAGCGDRYTIGV